MPITLFVRTGEKPTGRGASPKLTFDGTQRVVLGRGAGCDVRLPDPSVSARHATIRAQGAEFLVLDEASLNGTYVGTERLAPRMGHVLKSGDRVRLGRVVLEVLIDASPVTRDVGNVARDLALSLVEQGMRAVGEDVTPKVHVTEVPDTGAILPLEGEARSYIVGVDGACDLPLADPSASELHIERRGPSVVVRDLGATAGVYVGDTRISPDRDVPWRGTLPLRMGRTVLALEEPVALALQELEAAPDEAMPDAPPPKAATPSVAPFPQPLPPQAGAGGKKKKGVKGGSWTAADVIVLVASIVVLALSIAGFMWLIKG
jgi:pSer/pThr/pTyr-binding forkhead associated (FHA) protein